MSDDKLEELDIEEFGREGSARDPFASRSPNHHIYKHFSTR